MEEGSNDYGIKSRYANCTEGFNGGKTCSELLGNNITVKEDVVNCAGNIPYCPLDHTYLPWTTWTTCPKCSEESNPNPKRKRYRHCVDGKYEGSLCPPNVK